MICSLVFPAGELEFLFLPLQTGAETTLGKLLPSMARFLPEDNYIGFAKCLGGSMDKRVLREVGGFVCYASILWSVFIK